jgi:D-serine deaminase-like pyridoxal phosphate-dependent protein
MNITRPTLLLDERRCRANIKKMVEKAKRNIVTLRPHFKTHQSHTVGRWFREEGVTACTVSSIRMASYFAEDGWKDITVAFPLNYLEVDEINRLASSIKLNILVVDAAPLSKLLERLAHPVHCFIEADCGYHRSGVDPADSATWDAITAVIDGSPLLNFAGLLTHAGHSYACRSGIEVLKVHQQTTQVLKRMGAKLRARYPALILSVGDTPTCSLAADFTDIQEIRPGNFVFYDIMQRGIGSCSDEAIAMILASPVVAVYPTRGEIVVHGGGVHLSKDSLRQENGEHIFGQVVRMTKEGWSLPATAMTLKSLSQEHGIIRATTEECATVKPGDVLGILPVHSCMTADVMGEYYTLTGERIGMMPKTRFKP